MKTQRLIETVTLVLLFLTNTQNAQAEPTTPASAARAQRVIALPPVIVIGTRISLPEKTRLAQIERTGQKTAAATRQLHKT